MKRRPQIQTLEDIIKIEHFIYVSSDSGRDIIRSYIFFDGQLL